MKMNIKSGLIISGGAAGFVNGLFGAGGGMILLPLLRKLTGLKDHQVFSVSIAVILPICLVSLGATAITAPLPWNDALPYLVGSAIGGMLASKYAEQIPVKWMHRGLGLLILWGGLRSIC